MPPDQLLGYEVLVEIRIDGAPRATKQNAVCVSDGGEFYEVIGAHMTRLKRNRGDHSPRVTRQADRLRARFGDAFHRPPCATALRGLIAQLGQTPTAAAATRAAAHRVGLLAAGGIEPAARALDHTVDGERGPAFVELARWVTSESAETLRAAFGAPADAPPDAPQDPSATPAPDEPR